MWLRYIRNKKNSEGSLNSANDLRVWIKSPSILKEVKEPTGDILVLKEIGLSANEIAAARRFSLHSDSLLTAPSAIDSKEVKEPTEDILVLEEIGERRSLYVFGAGHVGYCVALFGAMLGMEVFLLDDRQEFLDKAGQTNVGVHLLKIDFSNVLGKADFDKNSAVVIVTRGHQFDQTILKQISKRSAGYVGMIGSRRRVQGIFRLLRGEGVSDEFLASVKAPVGLNIGAVTPQEIAIAIHAEIISQFRQRRQL